MKVRPVILDENCNPRIGRYLESMGEEVIRIDNGRQDDSILHLAQKTGAYIITRDRGFQDYQRTIRIMERTKSKLLSL